MTFKYSIRTVLFVTFASMIAAALPQQPTSSNDGQQARGAFITTRKKDEPAQTQPKPPVPTPPVPTPRPPANDIGKNRPHPKAPMKPPPPMKSPKPTPPVADTTLAVAGAGSIGLGYTLYQRNPDGDAVRVGPHTTFREGDAVRFVIEPNIDGYLYIFHSENNGEPQMIFPDHRLNDGRNEVKAHVPYEVPSRQADIKWFTFDEKPAVEKLHIVVARKPLTDVPMGQALLGFCKPVGADCTWKPARKQYEMVLTYAKEPKVSNLSATKGEAQAAVESDAISRGLGLSAKAPEPTLVQMNVSAKADVLVMTAELNHRK